MQMEGLILQINNLYNLQLHSSEKVNKGFLTENHILFSDDKKYFLKRYRFNRQDRIEEIHSAKKYFADGGIPVILPITNIKGDTFFLFEDSYFALFPFISDVQLDGDSLTDTAIISLGEMLGKIHLLGKVCKLPVKEKFYAWDKENALEKIDRIHDEIKKITSPTEFDQLALQSIETKKKLIQANAVKYEDLNLPSDHLIHGDYHTGNVFFGSDNKVSCVFDFEKTSYSPRFYELFRSLIYFLRGDINEQGLERARLYLKSYLSIYPTSKDELSKGLMLFYLKSIHGTWVEGEHYLMKSDRVDVFLRDDSKKIKYLSLNFEQFKNELFKEV